METWKMNCVALLHVILSLAAVKAIDFPLCRGPLGMESGLIKDDDIKASSSFDNKYVGAHLGRIRNDINGGAWCPVQQASPTSREWIEIDLHDVHLITASETQGRFGNGQGVEFAEAYTLEYYRPRLNKWIRYRGDTSNFILPGNVNTYTETKSLLDPPILASKIRFFPYSEHQRTVCMRVEVYGCKWSDGIVSYSMPQGDKRGNYEFYDATYDGHWDGEKLKYGLGQLTDGQVAPDDFRQSLNEDVQSWVGWKNDSRDNKPVEITFEFDQVREFSAVHIYVNNQFTKDVEVFKELKVFFSIDGKRYKGEPITYETFEDRILETPRNITVKLHHRVARFVKLQPHFRSKWILISEVTFESVPVTSNYTEEEEDPVPPLEIDSNVISKSVSPDSWKQYLPYIFVGLAVFLIAFTLLVVYFIYQQHRKYKNSPGPSQIPDKAALYRSPSFGPLTTASSDSADYAEPLHPQHSSFRKHHPEPVEHYAAIDIGRPHFTPPPPPPSTPPPNFWQRPSQFTPTNPN
ncbi:hypothetical protein ABEB36_001072 [Hypothenemus hampei]|uniref:F5/8 type C domain-containing protein n=1 Tax=Hypothenemus hampei TaxID=57062 RepID=A0ABD1FDD3_HYPHA